MDDCIDSFSDKGIANSVLKNVTCISRTGRFRLHRWIANDWEILRSLRVSEFTSKIVNLGLHEIPKERKLSLLWNPMSDVLPIKTVNKILPSSKRYILTFISSIFNLLGMLVQATLKSKLIIQGLWKKIRLA